jgi:hypothetical protein
MNNALDLPPSVTVGPRSLGVSVITLQGATVSVLLPKPGGFDDVPHDELVERATALALAALANATSALALNARAARARGWGCEAVVAAAGR